MFLVCNVGHTNVTCVCYCCFYIFCATVRLQVPLSALLSCSNTVLLTSSHPVYKVNWSHGEVVSQLIMDLTKNINEASQPTVTSRDRRAVQLHGHPG